MVSTWTNNLLDVLRSISPWAYALQAVLTKNVIFEYSRCKLYICILSFLHGTYHNHVHLLYTGQQKKHPVDIFLSHFKFQYQEYMLKYSSMNCQCKFVIRLFVFDNFFLAKLMAFTILRLEKILRHYVLPVFIRKCIASHLSKIWEKMIFRFDSLFKGFRGKRIIKRFVVMSRYCACAYHIYCQIQGIILVIALCMNVLKMHRTVC